MDMSNLTDLIAGIEPAQILAAVMAFDVPIPDAVILAVFTVLGLALLRAQRLSIAAQRAQLEAAYAAELATANRRAHHARSELVKLRRENEHERQKARSLKRNRAVPDRAAAAPKPVSVLREVIAGGAARL